MSHMVTVVGSRFQELQDYVANAILALQSEDLNRQRLEQCDAKLLGIKQLSDEFMQLVDKFARQRISEEELSVKAEELLSARRAQQNSSNSGSSITSDSTGDVDLF